MHLPIKCAPMKLKTFNITEIIVGDDVDNWTDDLFTVLFDPRQKRLQPSIGAFAVSVQKGEYLNATRNFNTLFPSQLSKINIEMMVILKTHHRIIYLALCVFGPQQSCGNQPFSIW